MSGPASRPATRRLLLTLAVSAGCGYSYRRFFRKSDDDVGPALDQRRFTPYTLVGKDAVSSTASVFTLRYGGGDAARDPPPETETPGLWGPPVNTSTFAHKLWSVELKQPALSIARSYTPLPPIPSDGSSPPSVNILRFLIRALPPGEMSPYLHSLSLGTAIPIRGPRIEADIAGATDVVFLAAGTGIAPALQCAYWLGRDVTGARMRLLVANRRGEDVTGGVSEREAGWSSFLGFGNRKDPPEDKSAFVKDIEAHKMAMQNRGAGMKVEYFVDEKGERIAQGDVMRKVKELQRDATHQGRKIIFVSGPEGFIDHWAGPKVWVRGMEVQGPLRGELGRMKLEGWEVLKL